MEALETVKLVDREPAKSVRIGTSLSSEVRIKLVQFLKENLDIFVLSHEDMPGISTKVIQHVGKSGFVSHTKHIAEATNIDLFHS